MQRVYVAWDGDEARRFLRLLQSHGIQGRVIEDREFPSRDEGLHDTEGAPEVWISDAEHLARAMELASGFEHQRKGGATGAGKGVPGDGDPDASDPGGGAAGSSPPA